jgi:hypothetical protein
LTALSAFGLFAVTAMVVCYALEHRSPWFILAFAGSCVLGSIYGFLQGAWPFGLVEAVWSIIALTRSPVPCPLPLFPVPCPLPPVPAPLSCPPRRLLL